MPRKPGKGVKRRNDVALTLELHQLLVHGYAFFVDETPAAFELEALWRAHREFIMEQIGKPAVTREDQLVHVPWGRRPWGWWEFEATELRRRLSGDPDEALPAWGYRFGVPRAYRSQNHGLVYESETDYIARLGLWLPGEREQVTPPAAGGP